MEPSPCGLVPVREELVRDIDQHEMKRIPHDVRPGIAEEGSQSAETREVDDRIMPCQRVPVTHPVLQEVPPADDQGRERASSQEPPPAAPSWCDERQQRYEKGERQNGQFRRDQESKDRSRRHHPGRRGAIDESQSTVGENGSEESDEIVIRHERRDEDEPRKRGD